MKVPSEWIGLSISRSRINYAVGYVGIQPTHQELLGHKVVKPTMIYTYVLNRGGRGVRSPMDSLGVDEGSGCLMWKPYNP